MYSFVQKVKNRHAFFVLSFILLVVFLSYSPILSSDFLNWDDDVHLLENEAVRSLDLEHIKLIFSQTINGTYNPLTIFSFALEYHFFGYNSFVYHFDNLLLHIIVTALIFSFSLRLGLSLRAAAFAAIVFGIHPMHVEPVAWVTERKDVLYSCFYMLALHSYWGYLQTQKRSIYVLTLALGILSVLAKPMALSLPLIFLLCDLFYGRKLTFDLIKEKIPFCCFIVPIVWVTYFLYLRIPGSSFGEGILIWIWCFIFHIRKFIYPVLSTFYYLPKPITLNNYEYLGSFLFFLLIVFSIFRLRRNRLFIFAIAYYFLSIFFLLRMGKGDFYMVADRFMYLPSLGFCMCGGVIVDKIFNMAKKDVFKKRMIAFCLLILLGILSMRTLKQCKIWQDSISYWSYPLSKKPVVATSLILTKLANAYQLQEEFRRALINYTRARKDNEVKEESLDLSDMSKDIVLINKVISLYKKAIEMTPGCPYAHYFLGELYQKMNLVDKAMEYYQKAVKINPFHRDAHFGLGTIYKDLDDPKKAIWSYQKAIEATPNDDEIYLKVINAYTEAIERNPRISIYRKAQEDVLSSYENFFK